VVIDTSGALLRQQGYAWVGSCFILARGKTYSLFSPTVIDEEKSFIALIPGSKSKKNNIKFYIISHFTFLQPLKGSILLY